jgi:putative FmdB family regulatory protein
MRLHVPLYEYQCKPNQHRFEVRQGYNEEPLQVCPECGGEVRRVIHPVGVVFKGSGFYVNDSRKSSPTAKPADGKTADTTTPETTSDSKTSDSKTSDSKTSETKTTESKAADSKPAPTSTGSDSK